MSFFKKLFSSDYRRAVALEGAGRYREAAERYLLAGERLGVARMHRLLARDTGDPWERVDSLRKALDFLPEVEDHGMMRAALHKELADALVQLVEHSGVMDRRDRGLLQEAVELYQDLSLHEDAADVLATLGYINRAAESYKAAGNIRRMEEMFRKADDVDLSRAEFDRAWDAYEFAQQVGDRLGVVEALARCVELKPEDAGLGARLEGLRRKMPRAGRITLCSTEGSFVLVGGESVTIGRDDDNGVLLMESGVSRRHARLSRRGGGFVLEDLGSSHGTFVGATQLRKALTLSREGGFRVGRSAELRYAFAPGPALPAVLSVDSGPLKGQRFVWAEELLTTGVPPAEPAWLPPGLMLRYTRGYWHVVPEESEGQVTVGGEVREVATLLQLGDELRLDAATLKVE